MEIILASASPRRKELLSQIGMDFRVLVSDVEEVVTKEKPEEIVMELSSLKANAVSENLLEEADISPKDQLVIGADTLVFLDEKQMGKPSDSSDAFSMLSSLQGKWHQVYTGVTCIRMKDGKEILRKSFYEETQVHFYPMTEKEIEEYVSSGEPMGKAGAYAIQGIGSKFVKEIKGDYNNVVGLPVARLYQEIKSI